MKKMIALAFLLAATLSAAAPPVPGEKSDADTLEKLRAQVQHILPSGWQAEFNSLPENPDRLKGDTPCLVISSRERVLVRVFSQNQPANAKDPDPIPRYVEIDLTPSPLLLPEARAVLDRANQEAEKKRIDFAATILQVKHGFNGPDPIPPTFFFLPKTDQEKRKLLEYSALWMRTEPTRLPTHYFDGLSFTCSCYYGPPDSIVDPVKSKEYTQILHDLDKILTPYETH